MKIGQRVDICQPLVPGKGIVVDIIPGRKAASFVKIQRYYGKKEAERQRRWSSLVTVNKRVVVERDGGGFLIVPQNRRNRGLVCPVAD